MPTQGVGEYKDSFSSLFARIGVSSSVNSSALGPNAILATGSFSSRSTGPLRHHLDDMLARLEAEKTTLKQEKTSLNQEKTSLEHEKTILKQEKTTLGQEKTTLEAEKTTLEQEKTILEQEKASWLVEKANLEQKKASWLEEKANLLEEQARWVDEKDSLRTKIRQLETEVSTLTPVKRTLLGQLLD